MKEVSRSTRMLLLGMVDADGVLRAGETQTALQSVGLNSEQIRVSLRRLVDDGLLTKSGRGLAAVFELTIAGAAVLQPDIDAYVYSHRQDLDPTPWNGLWYLTDFTIPESKRAARNELRSMLLSYGASIGSVYISPHDWRDLINRAAERLDVSDRITHVVATEIQHDGAVTPAELTRRLWPIDQLADGYREFLDRHGDLLNTSIRRSDEDRSTQFLRASIDYERCVRLDPLLPHELLPRDWPGPAARSLIRAVRERAATLITEQTLPPFFARYDAAMQRAKAGN